MRATPYAAAASPRERPAEPRLDKRVVLKPDGRYLILYTRRPS